MRARLETNAYHLLLQAIQAAKYAMMVSPVHLEEVNAISDAQERQEILTVLEKLPGGLLALNAGKGQPLGQCPDVV